MFFLQHALQYRCFQRIPQVSRRRGSCTYIITIGYHPLCTYNIINVYNMCSFKTQWKLTDWAGPAEPDCWWCLPWYLCLLEEWILSEIRSGVPWANMATKFKLNIRYVFRQIMPAFCKPQICDCFISRIFVLVRKGCRTIFVSN